MSTNETETPLEQAARVEALRNSNAGRDARDETEADSAIADIEAYVAETDPGSLASAEQQLDAWEIPNAPEMSGRFSDDNEALVSVFSAQSEGEAAIVRGILEAEGIPTTLDGLPSRILGNVFGVTADRWGDIKVPADRAEEARTVLEAVKGPQQGF